MQTCDLRVNNTGIRYDFSTEPVPIMCLYCLTVSTSVRNSTFFRSILTHLPVMSLNPSIPEITTVTWFSDKGPHFAQILLHLLNILLRFLCLFLCPQHGCIIKSDHIVHSCHLENILDGRS